MTIIQRVILVLIALFLLSSLSKNLFEYLKNVKFYTAMKEAYEKELKKNVTLKTLKIKKSDPYELEKTIRDKLNLGKPDEVVVILPAFSPSPTPPSPTPVPPYMQWWRVFFKK